MAAVSACPGCGLRLEADDGPAHPYIGASPACWVLYGSALARAYSDPVCRSVLQLAVDAYACQHPGVPGRRSAQSVAVHLMTLCLVLEEGADPSEGPKLHRRMVKRPAYAWLEPPSERGQITVADVLDAKSAAAYVDTVWAWARETWPAWAPHHSTVRGWLGAG
jgi:Family of unknown function (DUF5946)